MVWTGIMQGHRTPLIPMTARQYNTHVLETVVHPYRQALGEMFLLADDNARAHCARVVDRYCQQAGIQKMNWPAVSPDMKCIKHAWDSLKSAIHACCQEPNNVQDLILAAQTEWDNLPQERLDNLILSMPQRVRDVMRSRGGHTRH